MILFVIFIFGILFESGICQLPWQMSAYSPIQRFPSYGSEGIYSPPNSFYDQSPPFVDPYPSSYPSRPLAYDYQTSGMSYGGPAIGSRAHDVAVASLSNYVYDKDNFLPQGCGWDGVKSRCTDILNQCKGMCRDFANDVVTHDCRCVPFGYAALLGWMRT